MQKISKKILSLRSSRLLSFTLVVLLCLGFVLLIGLPSQAQFSLPEGLGTPNLGRPPSDVTRYGNIEVIWVRSPLDNKQLFEIASPTVYERSPEVEDRGTRVEYRAEEIEARLRRANLKIRDPDTLEVEVSQLNGLPIVQVRDENYSQPLVVVSITETDTDYHGTSTEQLTAEWRDVIQADLVRGLEEFSGDVLVRNIRNALWLALGLFGLTFLSWGLKRFVARRQTVLRQRKRELNVPLQPDELIDPQQSVQFATSQKRQESLRQLRSQFLQSIQKTLSVDRQLSLWSFVQWLLFWGVMLVWCIGIYIILRSIPYLAIWSVGALALPIELLSIWFFTGLALRVSQRLINQFSHKWQEREMIGFINLGDAQRRKLRITTIAGAVKGMVTVLVLVVAIISALNAFGIPTGSVLAIGGLFGLAISFGSQNLVKDLVNGFLILAEDQYAIGDVIDLGSASGLVENLNLRVTQLRSADGELVTVPNSSITDVKNLTRSWSRVNFSIDVAYATDPEMALSVLRQVAQDLYEDPVWSDQILDPPDVLGIDRVAHTGMTITVWIKTAPLQQWAVGRVFRLRVRKALEDSGIDIGVPRQTYVVEPSEVNSADRQSPEPGNKL